MLANETEPVGIVGFLGSYQMRGTLIGRYFRSEIPRHELAQIRLICYFVSQRIQRGFSVQSQWFPKHPLAE